jgi:small conductance mechanosensitive channel
LRTTDLRTADGLFVTIPNGDVFVSSITNYTRAPQRRIEIEAGVAYGAKPEEVERVALDAIAAVPGFLANPAPGVIYTKFGASAVQVSILYWVDLAKTDYAVARDQGIRRIMAAFDRQGIDMPYPTMSVVVPNQNPQES